jgi:hypothetical protein
LVLHAYINEMHGSRSKIPSKKSRPYIHDVKFLALLGAPYVYGVSRLRVKLNYINQLPIKHYKLIRSVYYRQAPKALDTRRKTLNRNSDVF